MTHRSLRTRLRTALVAGAAVLVIAAVLAGTALIVMRDRQDAITGVYFMSITEADAAHILLLDVESSLEGYVETGNDAALGLFERGRGEGIDDGPDTERMLVAELGADHPVLGLRTQAGEALDVWFGEHVEPILATVAAEGPGSVPEARLGAERAAFADLESLLTEYVADLRVERARANEQLRTWIDVTTGAFVVLVLGALVAGALLWVFLRRWVTDPLTALASDTRRVSGGDVRHAVAPSGIGEVAELSRDVEDMRARLVVLLEEAASAGEELERSHAALEEQAEDLRRSNRDLEQFAYVASHDLQEPLRKVASFTQLLASRYSGQLDERADQYIAFAVDGAKRMQRLINDLLGFSRVGRIGTEITDVDLRAALDQVVGDLQPTIEATGGEVAAGELPTVRGEAPLLTQLLANLVGNALKFRHPDRPPKVRIEARRVGGAWELSCTDNGIGIDPKYADRVFVIFQRLHPKEVYEGTGIGLALCKKIVEFHGGDIWIEQGVVEGAVIRWTLPVASEATESPRSARPATDAPGDAGSQARPAPGDDGPADLAAPEESHA